jgi:two-component system chemotaxis sensor kinase CheA
MADSTGTSMLFDDEMKEIVESFIVETREILEGLDQDLLELERGSTDNDLLNRIFRAAHTVKGTSGFLGFEQMSELTHKFEEILNKLRKLELVVTPSTMDVIFMGFDVMKTLLHKIESKDLSHIDLTDIMQKFDMISEPEADAPHSENDQDAAEVSDQPADSVSVPVVPPPQADDGNLLQGFDPLDDDEDKEDAAPRSEGAALSPDPLPAAKQTAKDGQDANATQQAGQSKIQKTTDSTIRVDVQRLDNLMNLVGELVLGRNRLAQISFMIGEEHEGEELSKELGDTAAQIDFITTELQAAIMKTRMVPIGKVFNKFPRLMRDLSRETNKEIDLVISGEETELDKSIIEEINDPLVHLLRNSVDHGVELPADREKLGKARKGTVWLRAEHEGNHIVITVEDDGRGIDMAKIKAKALEKGLITEADAAEMSTRDTFNLIFLPGFSTATKVTNISGRGVGMDVVRSNITRLNGIIDVESQVGLGTKIVIKLPLTLAIIQGLLVQVKQEVFVIPLSSVVEVVRVAREDIDTINGKEVFRIRNSVLPLVRIENVFTVNGQCVDPTRAYVVVVGLAETRVGIVVDSLLGQKEVVIKSLGGYLGNIDGIAGSTILGDGTVKMIIDIGELIKLVGTSKKEIQ